MISSNDPNDDFKHLESTITVFLVVVLIILIAIFTGAIYVISLIV
jgi:hypothetical protein